jgi:nucleoside triphosphatase
MKQKFPEPTVGALIINSQGKLLLAKSPKWFNKYTIPGGHVEVGENLKMALIREVKEEVGLDIEVKSFLSWQEAIYSKEFYKPKHFIFFDFYCTTKSGVVKVDGREVTDHMWVEPEEALMQNVDSFTRASIETYLKIQQEL